ncbi:MAG: asparagine synthase C-terminal domain-containing protein [Methanoregula sp.]|jgi:asparagine synthase (glutamine-hydrolysing)
MSELELAGWIELDGVRLTRTDIETILREHPTDMLRCGGEFFFSKDGCRARDHFGVMQGSCPKGTFTCENGIAGEIIPTVKDMSLEEAIVTAVKRRSDEGVTALSGGVDSTLVAHLAGRECMAVGLAGSHDLRQAQHAASILNLNCAFVEIPRSAIAEALPLVIGTIPKKDPVNTGIALTQYFITRWAGEHGYRRIITGQVADEIFGGYSRYLETTTLEEDLARDFIGLEQQAGRDQSIAALHGTYLSMPYLDMRVVRAARKIPASEKVQGTLRKVPLRTVAERFIGPELAWYEKKAMQYGSGVWKELCSLARKNGYKTSVQDYINHINRVEHGY